MRRREPAEGSFRSALVWSLVIHACLLVLLVGLGGALTPEPRETKLEWVWSAPQSAPQLAPPPVPATLAASAVPPTNNDTAAPVTPAPTTPQTILPQATGAQSSLPKPSSPTPSSPQSSSPQSPASTGPPEDAPQGTGYAIVPPRLRERPPLAMPTARGGVAGEVLLQVEVLADGRVGASRVIRSSGMRDLDELARQYVAGWIFQPAWQPQANKPVRVLTSVWVRFGIKKE